MEWVEKFNEWRENYDKLDYNEQKKFYELMKRHFPVQRHFNRVKLLEMFPREVGDLRVLEMGGWDGALAHMLLNHFNAIRYWWNIDFVTFQEQIPRYHKVILNDFLWKFDIRQMFPFNMFVSTHTFEHLKVVDVEKVLDTIKDQAEWMLIETPLEDDINLNWKNYLGSHVLDITMDELIALVEARGYKIEKRELFIFLAKKV